MLKFLVAFGGSDNFLLELRSFNYVFIKFPSKITIRTLSDRE